MLEDQLLDKIKIMIKKEIVDEKDSLLKIVEDIKKLNSDIDKAVDFMNIILELIMHESKELKGKVSTLVNDKQCIYLFSL